MNNVLKTAIEKNRMDLAALAIILAALITINGGVSDEGTQSRIDQEQQETQKRADRTEETELVFRT